MVLCIDTGIQLSAWWSYHLAKTFFMFELLVLQSHLSEINMVISHFLLILGFF